MNVPRVRHGIQQDSRNIQHYVKLRELLGYFIYRMRVKMSTLLTPCVFNWIEQVPINDPSVLVPKLAKLRLTVASDIRSNDMMCAIYSLFLIYLLIRRLIHVSLYKSPTVPRNPLYFTKRVININRCYRQDREEEGKDAVSRITQLPHPSGRPNAGCERYTRVTC